ncbi:Hypothetical predicted protein, partial [Podarcis lilfordi]
EIICKSRSTRRSCIFIPSILISQTELLTEISMNKYKIETEGVFSARKSCHRVYCFSVLHDALPYNFI